VHFGTHRPRPSAIVHELEKSQVVEGPGGEDSVKITPAGIVLERYWLQDTIDCADDANSRDDGGLDAGE